MPEFKRCEHIGKTMRRRTQSNGVVIVVEQCDRCGANCGSRTKKNFDVSTLPEWDQEIQDRWYRESSMAYDYQRQKQTQEWWDWYTAYLKSPAWSRLRTAALRRDKGICQGCLERSATQVHHLTYARVGCEMLFDLISVCDACHERIHPT